MRTYWWANPVYIVLFLMMPILVIAASVSDSYYQDFGHVRRYIEGEAFLLALISLVLFCLGSWMATVLKPKKEQGPAGSFRVDPGPYSIALWTTALIAICGNVVGVLPILANPDLVMAVLFQEGFGAFQLKELLLRIPGLTSVSNIGPLVGTLFGAQLALTGKPLNRWERLLLGLVIISVFLRAFLGVERLALIEFAVPYAVARYGKFENGRWNPVLSLGPIIGIILLIVLFSTTEYFRSWVYYRQFYSDFWSFMLARIAGYYTTALNNGAGLMTNFDPNYDGRLTLAWFYKFPLFPWANTVETEVSDFLLAFANREFNNTSGVFAPINDFGITFGVGLWFFLGGICGLLYRGFSRHEFVPNILYPSWIIGIYEILRIFYWGETRYFVVMIFTVMIILFVTRQRSRTYTPINSRRAHPLAPVRPQRPQ